jgi:hypothetical protein
MECQIEGNGGMCSEGGDLSEDSGLGTVAGVAGDGSERSYAIGLTEAKSALMPAVEALSGNPISSHIAGAALTSP